jgi:hypothetical protein
VLQADDVVHDCRHNFACRFGIAMRDSDGDLFVTAENDLWIGLTATLVVDERIVNAAKARTGI